MVGDFGKYFEQLSKDAEFILEALGRGAMVAVEASTGALQASNAQFLELNMATIEGRKLTAEDVDKLEKALVENPEEIKLRALLLGKYFSIDNDDYKNRRIEHIAWVVKHCPKHPIARTPYVGIHKFSSSKPNELAAYERIKSLWLEQIQADDVDVLRHASQFFFHADKEIAEKCLLRVLKEKPFDRKIKKELGFFYSLWDGHEQEALQYLEAALAVAITDGDRFDLLEDLPERAFAAGDYSKATKAADKLLAMVRKFRNKKEHNCDDAINSAHSILGRIALKNGDRKAAKFHLALSVTGLGSPRNSLRPSLDLARELLDRGEKSAVLQFLDEHERLCGLHWESDFELRFEVESGEQRSANNEESFVQSFLDRQIEVRSDPGCTSPKLIERSIDYAQRRLDSWLLEIEESKQRGDEALYRRAEIYRQMYEEHLRKLKVIAEKSV